MTTGKLSLPREGYLQRHYSSRSESPSSSRNASPARRVIPPLRDRVHCSDSNVDSPWARKIILSLDGGGIRGYASLLLLKRLLHLVSEIETGLREGYETSTIPNEREDKDLCYYDEHHASSATYHWQGPQVEKNNWKIGIRKPRYESLETIDKSVEETFKGEVGDFKPHHYFDYIAGTSTGGLSAIMLSRLEMNIDDALEQYDLVGNEVFAKHRHFHSIKAMGIIRPQYKTINIEAALRKVIKKGAFKEETLLKLQAKRSEEEEVPLAWDTSRCRTIVVAHEQKKGSNPSNAGYLFRSYDHPFPWQYEVEEDEKPLNPGHAHHYPIWKVARATSAAPLYFKTIEFGGRKFKDGAFFENNPASVALIEVEQMHRQPVQLVLSLGTGKYNDENLPNTLAQKKVSSSRLGHLKDTFAILSELPKLIAQSEKTHNLMIKTSKDRASQRRFIYHRFNPEGGMKDIPLDEWKGEDGYVTKKQLLDRTKDYIKEGEVHQNLLECARILVLIRRKRACTERWESYASNLQYRCPESGCRVAKTFMTRNDLREHAFDDHEYFWETETKVNHILYSRICSWGQCHSKGGRFFISESQYKEHLKKKHDIKDEKIGKRNLENWLDEGRLVGNELN
ncbi:FabD/lysophospholipase-like protein [Corynespora cassiicola Philippines]|uniref:FabD/lysophospholipase-like protein n=1 Tax=Corynespora cassiicola Philippines TaxID=1448308 RepID=A0A2T2PCB2_CORCC|nr:FabD/lysophospholipase-like protein [Corynespora cassiicola Philippines]